MAECGHKSTIIPDSILIIGQKNFTEREIGQICEVLHILPAVRVTPLRPRLPIFARKTRSGYSMKPNVQNQHAPKGNPFMGFLWGILIVLFLNWLIFPNLTNRKINVTDYGTFIGKMEEGKIKEVMIKNNQIYFTVAEDGDRTQTYQTGEINDPQLVDRLLEAESIDMDLVARATAGSSGAELANIVNEAALRAVRMKRNRVTTNDLEESVETVIAGAQKKGKVISTDEKRIIAYHEIGHAMVAAMQTHSAPVHKITIIPRTSGALGYTMQVDNNEQVLLRQPKNSFATQSLQEPPTTLSKLPNWHGPW